MSVVEQLQGNVVDLSGWDLAEEGSADSQLVVAWMASGPGGLTRLVLDGRKACAAVVDALLAHLERRLAHLQLRLWWQACRDRLLWLLLVRFLPRLGL